VARWSGCAGASRPAFEALARVQSTIAQLREITSPSAMLARAPGALCECSPLDRAILSMVRGGRLVAEAAHLTEDPAGAQRTLELLRATRCGSTAR